MGESVCLSISVPQARAHQVDHSNRRSVTLQTTSRSSKPSEHYHYKPAMAQRKRRLSKRSTPSSTSSTP